GSARVLERGDTGGLIGGNAGWQAGVDIGHALNTPGVRRIEIRIENAAAAAELEFEAGAFPDLQCGIAEVADELGRGEAEDAAAALRARRLGNRRRGRLGRYRTDGAGGEEQGQGWD